MLMKLLLLVAVVAAVYYFFFKPKPLKKSSGESHADDQEMVACSRCGTYTALKEAKLRDGKYFCSAECLDAEGA